MTPKLIVISITAVAVCVAGLAIGAVIEIFDDPASQTAKTIGSYETFLGSVLALFAAMITVLGVFFSARLPIEAQRRQQERQRIQEQIVAGRMLAAEVSEVGIQLVFLSEELKKHFREDMYKFPSVHVPEQLQKFEIVKTQPTVCVDRIAVFLSKLAMLRAAEGKVITEREVRNELRVQVEDAHDAGKQLRDDLYAQTVNAIERYEP